MDKRNLYDGFEQLDQDLKRMSYQVNEMRSAMIKIVEANAKLEVENQHLRDRLVELENKNRNEISNKQELSKARMNLEKLYETGFHVCNVCYGSRRENDEECAFCLEVIYGERK